MPNRSKDMPLHLHSLYNTEEENSYKIIEIAVSDLGKQSPKKRKTKKSAKAEPFMGLEELFWESYAVHSKRKP